jgi:hypothetical protein
LLKPRWPPSAKRSNLCTQKTTRTLARAREREKRHRETETNGRRDKGQNFIGQTNRARGRTLQINRWLCLLPKHDQSVGGFAPNRIVTPGDLHLMGTSSTANRNSRNVLACQLRSNQSVPNELGWPGPGSHFVVIIIIPGTPPPPVRDSMYFFRNFWF